MDFTNFKSLGFFAFLTPLILFYQQSRNFLLKIFRIFWKERVISYDFSPRFYRMLYDKSFILNFDDYDLINYSLFSFKHNYYVPITFKGYKFEIFLYKNFIPIFLFGAENSRLKIRYFKYTFNFEKFFIEVINDVHTRIKYQIEEQKESEDRFYIEEIRGKSLKSKLVSKEGESNSEKPSYSSPSSEQSNNYTIVPFDTFNNKLGRIIGFNEDEFAWSNPKNVLKNKYQFTEQGLYVLNQVEKWLKAEKWYQERNIPYRRSILLNGEPGTGKSTLVLEIAKKLKIPLLVFDLSNFDNEEFCKSLDNLTSYPAIILIEDIDNIFNGRESLIKSVQYPILTFDYFINKISGVKSIKNKFLFITTNHLDKIDVALLRSGRIDEKVELKSLNKKEKLRMADIVFDGNERLVSKVVEEGINDTTADFENRVTREALCQYWNK